MQKAGLLGFPRKTGVNSDSQHVRSGVTGHEFRKTVVQPRNNLTMMNGKTVLHIVLANQAASTKQLIQVCLLVAYCKVSHCVLQ